MTACQLYLHTPAQVGDIPGFADLLAGICQSVPVAAVLLRMNDAAVVREALAAVQPLGVACLLDGSAADAKTFGADGLHLADGWSARSLQEARRLLGRDAMIGASCGLERHGAMVAAEAGADYVLFGPFSDAATNGPHSLDETELLSWWQDMMEIPCVATAPPLPVDPAATARMLAQAGADFLTPGEAIWRMPGGPQPLLSDVWTALQAA
jgi:thiamine-phosphate pyrophosphorylase